MTDLIKELTAASRALLPYLETSSDPMPSLEDAAGAARRRLALSEPERMRQRADEIEAEEAAIWRFRKAVEALSEDSA